MENFTGKTKKEVLDIMEDGQFNDIHSDQWVFLIKKDIWGNRSYLHLFFEDNIAIRGSIVFKYFWQKIKYNGF